MCDAPSRISAFNRSADKSTDNNGGQHAEVQDLATNVQIRRERADDGKHAGDQGMSSMTSDSQIILSNVKPLPNPNTAGQILPYR